MNRLTSAAAGVALLASTAVVGAASPAAAATGPFTGSYTWKGANGSLVFTWTLSCGSMTVSPEFPNPGTWQPSWNVKVVEKGNTPFRTVKVAYRLRAYAGETETFRESTANIAPRASVFDPSRVSAGTLRTNWGDDESHGLTVRFAASTDGVSYTVLKVPAVSECAPPGYER